MPIGCGRTHSRPARRLRKGEARCSFLCNERQRRADQRFFEIAMVIATGAGRPVLLAPAHVTSLYMTRNRTSNSRNIRAHVPLLRMINAVLNREDYLVEALLHCGRKEWTQPETAKRPLGRPKSCGQASRYSAPSRSPLSRSTGARRSTPPGWLSLRSASISSPTAL